MSTEDESRYVRLRVDLVLEIADSGELTSAALEQIDADEFMPDEERSHARAAVQEDEAEALAYLVDPFDLVNQIPGAELAQASWTSEEIEYDPTAVEWGLEDEEEGWEDLGRYIRPDGFGGTDEDEDGVDGEGGAGRA